MCLAPVAWMPEKTRIELTSSGRRNAESADEAVRASLRLARGARTNGDRRRRSCGQDRAIWGDGYHLANLGARLLARADGAATTRVAGRCGRRGVGRAPPREPAARLRRRGAQPAREP